MITIVNPGSKLELLGELLVEHDGKVFDRESGDEVTIAELLRTFSYDPSEPGGWVRITIQACPPLHYAPSSRAV